uniref:Transglutaminase-like domain-containing protein n=1 Tax=Panagrolaimus sp. ES5 TaxID=591445 RepID=A0AC34FNE8_9BILA
MGRLDVNSVDLKIDDNAKTHFTTNYTWQNDIKLVARRGFPINIRLKTTGRIFNPDVQVLVLEFTLDEKLLFREEEKVKRVRVRSSKEIPLDSLEWKADLIEINEHMVDIRLTFPPSAPISNWKLKILSGFWSTRHQTIDLDETYFSRLHKIVFYIICNPFLLEDETYMTQRNARDAYLFQEGDVWYSGIAAGRRSYSFHRNPWLHSQFEENTMKVTMFLLAVLNNNHLKGTPGLSMEDRESINRYLLQGNWDKVIPPGGRAPISWLGTSEIINEFALTRQQVKYAQCWVYAGVFVTLLRTIGIPCRTITCIESAHDADASLTVDKKYLLTRYGGFEPYDNEGNETTWNFHVWTEMWTRRSDCPEGYDGWQVVDATPQERSEKLFQCGPVPVKAIREGRLELPYDGGFVYSEVNADLVRWFFKKDEFGNLKLITTNFEQNSYEIGRALLTPNPRNLKLAMNITGDYKAAEGSNEEREMHIRAIKSAGAAERHEKIRLLYGADVERQIKEDIEIDIEEINKVEYGVPIVINVEIQNLSDHRRTVMLSVVLATQFHTGAEASKINQINEEIELAPQEGNRFEFKTTLSEYAKHVAYLRELSAIVSASVVETRQAIYIEEKFQISGSAVRIEAPDTIKVGDGISATILFKNPLNATLHDARLILHSGSLSKPKGIVKFPSVIAGRQSVKVYVKFRAIGEGARLLIAVVNAREISNMTATHFVRAVNPNLYNNDARLSTF